MRALKDEVARGIYKSLLTAGVTAPKHINDVAAAGIERADGGISKCRPAQRLMTVGVVGAYGERSVEQKHALPGPAREIAIGGNRFAQVVVDLLEDIDERRRHLNAIGYRKTKPHRLSLLMVGILPDDDHPHLVERTKVEGVEDQLSRGIAHIVEIFLTHSQSELFEVGLNKLATKCFAP